MKGGFGSFFLFPSEVVMSRKNSMSMSDFGIPIAPRTVAERFKSGADESRGLSGSMPLNSQPGRRSQCVAPSDAPYGEDIANGVTYE
jgi:hypothetical protein